ncbi:MAG: hypothetical protein BIFFINMI_03897 [Phycisphaerae bacterium]|nr:hypothetical protein [Phycisphaerae bacterium]
MKRMWVLLAVLAMAGWLTAWNAAGDGEAPRVNGDQPRKEGEPRREGDAARPAPMRGEVNRMAAQCNLTDDQKQKINELLNARDKEIREVMMKYQQQVYDALTDEQKATLVGSQVTAIVEGQFRRANLTEEQLGKIQTEIADRVKGVAPGDEKAKWEASRKVSEFVYKAVLTEEQKTALRGGHREGDRPKVGPREGDNPGARRGEGDQPGVKKGPGDNPAARQGEGDKPQAEHPDGGRQGGAGEGDGGQGSTVDLPPLDN